MSLTPLVNDRVPTDRLRHVAHVGVRARPFSYLIRGKDVPDGRIDVTLTAPSGGVWSWEVGTSNGGEISTVAGPALDFCLVVTQRGNLADTDLSISGDQAGEWMSIAQAFAGPPGPGTGVAIEKDQEWSGAALGMRPGFRPNESTVRKRRSDGM